MIKNPQYLGEYANPEQNVWADIKLIEAKVTPTTCSACNNPLEHITTAPLARGALRYACTYCRQRYNVIVLQDLPSGPYTDLGCF